MMITAFPGGGYPFVGTENQDSRDKFFQVIRQLLYGWNFMRILRLGMGIFALVQAFRMNDNLLGAAGAFLVLMAVLNLGCCGVGGCSTGYSRKPYPPAKNIEYEEVD